MILGYTIIVWGSIVWGIIFWDIIVCLSMFADPVCQAVSCFQGPGSWEYIPWGIFPWEETGGIASCISTPSARPEPIHESVNAELGYYSIIARSPWARSAVAGGAGRERELLHTFWVDSYRWADKKPTRAPWSQTRTKRVRPGESLKIDSLD